MTKRARIIFIVLVVVAAVGVIAAVALGRRGPSTLEMVEVHEVTYDSMTETISGTGSFVPGAKSTAYAKVSGAVEEILVEEGQSVDEGDSLLQIEDDDYAQALEKAQVSYQTARRAALQQIVSLQNTVKTAERNLAKAKRSHTNNIELREADAISQEQFQQSEEALEEAQDALASAQERLNLYMGRSMSADPILSSQEAEEVVDQIPDVRQAALNVEDARDSLRNTRPRAPSSGTVAMISVEEGGIVTPNAPLVRIERLNEMTAEVQIDEVDIGKISTGDSAEISSDSILGETLVGTVGNISPVIQRVGNTRVSTVEISIDTDGRRLKSGASCTARISTTTKERALVIPITAYQTENEETFAYIMEPVGTPDGDTDGGTTRRYRLERRRITLGLVTVNQVEVTGGLSEGELVAAGNFSRLREDMLVGRGQSRS